MPYTLIAAVDRAWGIGKKGELLWRLPADLARFRAVTMGSTLLMGRKTFQSLPGLLPGRAHAVLSRDAAFHPAGVSVYRSAQAALACPAGFVIGGGEIYSALLPHCNRALITKIDALEPLADAFCPNLDLLPAWVCTTAGPWHTEQGLRFRWCEYVHESTV
jgi:dihydrofolate reductase